MMVLNTRTRRKIKPQKHHQKGLNQDVMTF